MGNRRARTSFWKKTACVLIAVCISCSRAVSLPQELHIDWPFIFVIRDVPTRTILFVGWVLDPLDKGFP